MQKIIIRQRFPNFVCDGMPYGRDEKMYRYDLDNPEEFFDIEWVREKMVFFGVTHWYISKSESNERPALIMGKDASGSAFAYAWLIKGDTFLPVEME